VKKQYPDDNLVHRELFRIERRFDMEKNMTTRHRLWYVAAVLVLVLGCFVATFLAISTLKTYPSLIENAYNDPLQKVEVPGEAVLELKRKGAYAVYYETAESAINEPPTLDCALISNSTGDEIPLVPDYVPTNRYMTKDDRVGVLVYSTTIQEPGRYTFSCGDSDQLVSNDVVLAIGPNYFFEFFRVAWNIGGSLLGGAGVLCASAVLSLGIVSFALIDARNKHRAG
jgi:hypothetical protein